MDDSPDAVKRALGYPYERPSRSFLQAGDRTLELPPTGLEVRARRPLLALASNAAPEVLARKLAAGGSDVPVPVIRAALTDFDVVYSAHISAYGSVPAAIQSSPGTEVTAFVLYLTDAQMLLISKTEPNYELRLLQGVSCRLETGGSLAEVAAYVSRHGCLAIDGSEVALSAIPARARRFPSMSEPVVLERVRALLSPEQSLASFIGGCVADPGRAGEWTGILRGAAKPFAWAGWTALEL